MSSSPTYDVTTKQVVLTYDDGDKCNNGHRWRSVIAFSCAESLLQVCYIFNLE